MRPGIHCCSIFLIFSIESAFLLAMLMCKSSRLRSSKSAPPATRLRTPQNLDNRHIPAICSPKFPVMLVLFYRSRVSFYTFQKFGIIRYCVLTCTPIVKVFKKAVSFLLSYPPSTTAFTKKSKRFFLSLNSGTPYFS